MSQSIHPQSPGAIVMRNYHFTLQEVADIGALLLFLHASAIHQIISDYRITARDGRAMVEVRGECTGVWQEADILNALKKAVAAITEQTAQSLPQA